MEIETEILKIVCEYLSEVRDEQCTISPETPFMDAGLDSLDMLKVSAN